MEIGRITVTGDFGDDDNGLDVDKIIRDGDKLQRQLDEFRRENADANKAAVSAAIAGNKEVIKSNEEVEKSQAAITEERKREIETTNKLKELIAQFNRISEDGKRKTEARSKRARELNEKEIELLTEIIAIQQALGITDEQKISRLARVRQSQETYLRSLERQSKLAADAAVSTKKNTDAIVSSGEAAEKASNSTDSLSDSNERLTQTAREAAVSVNDQNAAEDKLDRDRTARVRRNARTPPPGGGGGGGGTPPPPPGGPPGGPPDDFDFTKYLERIEERRRQIVVELRTVEGARKRALERELRDLSAAETFEENRARLEDQRLKTLQSLSLLQRALEQQDDRNSSSAERLRRQIDRIGTALAEVDNSLSEGRGNVDSLTRSLRQASLQSDQLIKNIDEENVRRRQTIDLQFEQVTNIAAQAFEEARVLEQLKGSLRNIENIRRVQQQINELRRIGRQARNVEDQLDGGIALSDREFARISANFSQRRTEAKNVGLEAAKSEEILRGIFALEEKRVRSKIDSLRAQRDVIADPRSISIIDREIASAERRLRSFARDFETRGATVNSLTRSLGGLQEQLDSVLQSTREQSDVYDAQREIAERNTRGLREDIRSQRLILDNLLSQTKSLEAQREIKRAIADIDALEERRRRDVLSETFSPEQFDRLAVQTQLIFTRSIRARQRALEIERSYTSEIERQRGVIQDTISLADERARVLSAQLEEVQSASSRLEIERELARILERRRVLSLQLSRESVIGDRDFERISQQAAEIELSSQGTLEKVNEIEQRFIASREFSVQALQERIALLRAQSDIVTEPSSVKALGSEIERVETLLADINRRYEDGKANVDLINDSVERTLFRTSRVLDATKEQNLEYEKQREIAEINTRGLREDIRSQRLILDNLLSQTKNLETQRQIRKAIADLDALEERRQRDVLSDNFSPEQFDRLAVQAQLVFRDNIRTRQQAIEQERQYNAEISRQSSIIREIALQLSDRDALFKAGFTEDQIVKFEVALQKLKRELEDTASTGRSVDDLGRRIRRFGADIDQSRAPMGRFELALSRLRDRLGFLGNAFRALDSQSRGFSLFTSLATAIVEPLAAVVLQLAGGLLAVASSAVAAGTALGGALVAGAAQALPVIALLGAGFKSLIDVVQISNRQRQDEASNLAREARGVGGAAPAVNRLADANNNLTEAQRRLSDARRQAIRDLEDLADREREAELAARSAALSVADALIALDAARATGSALDIRRAEIQLAGARISERQAERDLGRTRFDTTRQRAEGVEGNEQVVSAKRALAQAERSLAEARTSGASAAGALSQATARLNEQIEQLSPGQRELLEGINRLRRVFRSGPFVEIRDIVLQPFIAATDALADLGRDSGLVGSFRALASGISRTLGGAIQSLFSSRTRDFLKFINGEAALNVEILFEGFRNLGSIIANIAQGAAPLFRDILTGIVDTLGRIDRSLTAGGLEEFFNNLGGSVDAFGQLIEETFLLLKNLFELSAPAGDTLVSTFATFLRGINQQLADPVRRREIRNWFEEVARGTAAFGGALRDLTLAIFGGLNPDRLRQFSVVISDILAPAIQSLVTLSGQLFNVLSLLEKVPLATELTAIATATIVLGKTFSTLLGIAGLLATSVRGLVAGLAALRVTAAVAGGPAGLAGFSTVLVGAGRETEKARRGLAGFSRGLETLSRGRALVLGLGTALTRLGPYGLAAGASLLLFGDQILDLVDSTTKLEKSAKDAADALLRLEDVGDEKRSADLDLRQATIDARAADARVADALAFQEEAERQLKAAKTREERAAARRLLENAQIEVENAQTGVIRARRALDEAQTRANVAGQQAIEQARKSADLINKAFKSVEPFVVGPERRLTPKTKQQMLEELKQGLYSEEAFQEMEQFARDKAFAIIQTIIDAKGDISKKDLEIVFSGVFDEKSAVKILQDLELIPKDIKVKASINEKELRAQAERTGQSVEKQLIARLQIVQDFAAGVESGRATRPAPANRIGAEQDFADGGIVRATPGGVVIRAAEDGYDEFIITSDPTKRGRSRDVLRRAARAILSEDPTQRNDEYGRSEGDPPSLRGRGRGSATSIPSSPLAGFFTMFRTAQALDEQDIPYSWGGGHVTPARPTTGIRSDGNDGTDIVGLDCSSSVSAVLQSAYPGFPTITSGEFPRQSIMNPGQGLVTIWSNNKHVFMTFGGEDWGTNSGDPGGGPGFHSRGRSGFTASYPDGLGPEATDGGLFGRVYTALIGKSASVIDGVEDQFSSLGQSADNIPGFISDTLGDRSKSTIPAFYDAASATISRGLSLFQQFQNGGTVQGRTGEPKLVVAHAGETILDAATSRSLKDGRGSKEFVRDFFNSLSEAFKQLTPELRDSLGDAFRGAFRNLGININRDSLPFGAGGRVPNLVSNIVVDNKPDKPGGRSRFNILEGALQFISGGFKPESDPDAKAILGTTTKRIRDALKKVTDRFAGFLGRIEGAANNAIELANRAVSGAQVALGAETLAGQGSVQGGVFRFRETGGTGLQQLTAQGLQAVTAAEAERASLVGQRTNLITARAEVDTLIGSTQNTVAGLNAKLEALKAARAKLKADRDTAQKRLDRAPKARKGQIRKEIAQLTALIEAVDAEIVAVRDQIEAANATIANLEGQRDTLTGQITSTDQQIAATQGTQIDALISLATGGRFTPEQAETYLNQARDLAIASNDRARLDAIERARLQIRQTQEGAEQGLLRSQLRFAELTGDEAGRRTALEGIIASIQEQRAGIQTEINRLVGEGVDLNSPELLALRQALIDLDIAIKENTDALNGTTTQNFSSTAWQLFRRAIFGGENQLLQGFSGVGGIESATASITTPSAPTPDTVYMLPVVDTPGSGAVPAAGANTQITVNVNEAEQTADPLYLASALAFALDGMP